MKMDLKNLEYVCRICLKQSEDLESIFGHKDLTEKINICGGLKIIPKEKFPNKICSKCVLLLESAFLFKTLYVRSDEILKNLNLNIGNKNKSEKTVPQNINKTIKSNKFTCKQCEKMFYCEISFEKHIRNHRKSTILYKSRINVKYDVYQCDLCHNIFKSKSVLIQHLEIHSGNKKFICEVCGRTFGRRDYLLAHVQIHSGEKEHACLKCDYKTSRRSSLLIHLRTHSKQRLYTCDICGRSCTTSSNLLVHRKTHHFNKTHNCEFCTKIFAYKTSLNEHMVCVHEGRKTFTCSVCNLSYTRKRGLMRHTKQKHQTSAIPTNK